MTPAEFVAGLDVAATRAAQVVCAILFPLSLLVWFCTCKLGLL